MSYHRKRRARAMGNVTSLAPGARVYNALSGIQSRAPGKPVSTMALGGVPDWYRAMSGAPDWYKAMQGVGSLGDDTLSNADWQTQMLIKQQELIDAQHVWAAGDRTQKWIAIVVTASIPLFGAVWRALGIGQRKT